MCATVLSSASEVISISSPPAFRKDWRSTSNPPAVSAKFGSVAFSRRATLTPNGVGRAGIMKSPPDPLGLFGGFPGWGVKLEILEGPSRAMAAAGAKRPPPADDLPAVLHAVATTVRTSAPLLRVERKWAQDWRAGRDLVLAYGKFQHHVGIEFWRGTSLPDPAGLLEGTGKNLRHVKVRSVAEARAAPLRALIRAAVQLDATEEKRPR